MKSVTKRYSVFLAVVIGLMVLALVLGCQRRGGELPDEVRTVQILSTVSYEKASKGLVVQETPLASVRFLQTNGATPTSLAGATPFLGNRAADGSIAWQGTEPTYNRAEQNAHFVAYHPQGTETTNTKTDWLINGKTDLLLSTPWDAGTHSAPKTGTGAGETPLTFDHVLAQLCVVFKAEAGVDLARVQAQYGKIKGLTFVGTLPTATYTLATNEVTFSGAPTDLALLQPDCETAFAAVAVPANSNADINAAALLAPTTGVFTMILATENHPAISVAVQLTGVGGNKDFEVGLKHTVVMTLKANTAEVVVSGCSIVDWTAQYTAGSDVGI